MDHLKIKSMAKDFGADLCGIASVKRFNDTPHGFNPLNIYSKCKSVIVFAKRVPAGSLSANSCVPYTHANNVATQEVDRIGFDLCQILEDSRIEAIPIPSDDPSEYWEEENQYAQGILSLRHAGYLAGLGVLGKNTLLINEKYGNMIQIGAVLVNLELESDPIATYTACLKECGLCIDSCPQKALDGLTVSQKLCRPLSNFVTQRGHVLKKCNLCRSICPNALGLSCK
ncbi:MAG: hypothetical protein B655_1295 [Methanobacterium sp. Maddingley MBC34]|nr:MAG: hypothetical protein B655_1295 [Methanobacterium sp. Maddingley MBC34]